MTIDENSRHAMYTRLQDVLGPEHARVLMEHLPPVGWAEVATKHDVETARVLVNKDLGSLRVEMASRFERMDSRFEAINHKLTAAFERGLRSQTRIVVTWMIAVTSLALGLAALASGGS